MNADERLRKEMEKLKDQGITIGMGGVIDLMVTVLLDARGVYGWIDEAIRLWESDDPDDLDEYNRNEAEIHLARLINELMTPAPRVFLGEEETK